MTALADTNAPPVAQRLARHATLLPRRLLLATIAAYQRLVSPLLPVVTLGACGCRFTPTCSHYAAEAIRRHGALAGTALAFIRLLKCTPLHSGGVDPVPLILPTRRARSPICQAVR